ncbi:MAG: carboxypeptidase regulatory-like domain-containing protein, partial [Panacibacter sp.]
MAKCYLWIILFTLMACTGSAQETTSEIAGIVVSNDGPSSHATVTAVHLPTGTVYTTTTRKDGRYNLPNLKVGGPYIITVSFIGYKEEKQENILLILGEEFKADFILDTDYKVLQGLTVNAQPHDKVFNYNRTGSQEIISRLQLERLPAFSRSLKDFARLIPSASGMSLGGRNGLYNSVTIDGVNFNNVVSISSSQGKQIPGPPISLETIEQIQVNITPYDVRMGGFTGSSINSVTRSGTNNMQGAIYSYFNGADAMGYKVGNTTLPKTDFSYLMKGFYVSGPIVKNKLFFFLSAEREVTLYPVADFTASDAMHAPGSTVSFANADTLTRLREFLINKYNYDPGEFHGYSYKTQRDILSAKIDWTINSKNSFILKYNFLNSSRENPAGNTG